MSGPWWSAAEPPRPLSDSSSEIVWNSLSGIAVFDHGGRLAFANPAFRESRQLSQLVDAQGYLTEASLESARRRAIRRGSAGLASLHLEVAGSGLDAELIPLKAASEWSALVLRLAQHSAPEDADRLSLQLVVHELRGSLLLMNSALEELTQAAEKGDAGIRAAVRHQARSVSRLQALVQGLADLGSARELDQGRREWTEVDLCRLVAEVGEQYRDLASVSGRELEVWVEPGVLLVRGDPALLGRAVANLVDNALKYASPDSAIRLSLHRRGALAVIEVADSGPGIPLEHQQEVFSEFVRLPGEGADRPPGTGLGLAVARRVVEAHGGRLSLQSAAGAGSTFKMSFLLGRDGGGAL